MLGGRGVVALGVGWYDRLTKDPKKSREHLKKIREIRIAYFPRPFHYGAK